MCQSAIITGLSVCGIRGSLIISCRRCMEHFCNSRRFQSNHYRPSINSSSPLVRHCWSFTVSECGLVRGSQDRTRVLLVSGFNNYLGSFLVCSSNSPPWSTSIGSSFLRWMGEDGGEHSVAVSWLVRNSNVVDWALCVSVFMARIF